jgi:Flp pilus assembly protein TadG
LSNGKRGILKVREASMRSNLVLLWRQAVRSCARPLKAWCRDQGGVTAVEFAMVAVPFLMLLFGIITVGLFFFTTFALENAVERAARLIRTGQVQESGMTAAQFKEEVCEHAPAYVDCASKMRVNVQNFADFANIVTASCVDNGGNLVPPAGTSYSPGGSGEVVLVTVCYEWELAGNVPFLSVGSMPNGSALIQASVTFRTEPYSN